MKAYLEPFSHIPLTSQTDDSMIKETQCPYESGMSLTQIFFKRLFFSKLANTAVDRFHMQCVILIYHLKYVNTSKRKKDLGCWETYDDLFGLSSNFSHCRLQRHLQGINEYSNPNTGNKSTIVYVENGTRSNLIFNDHVSMPTQFKMFWLLSTVLSEFCLLAWVNMRQHMFPKLG